MLDPEDFQVILTYKQLSDLMEAVNEIPKLREEVKRYEKQVTAVKGMYLQLLDRVSELMRLI